MRRPALLFVASLIALTAALCAWLALPPLYAGISRAARDLRAVLALQQWARAQTSAADVSISLTSQTGLTLTVINSAWNQLPPASQQALARDLAQRALKKYTGDAQFGLVTIILVDQPLRRGNAAPRLVATYGFTVQSLSP